LKNSGFSYLYGSISYLFGYEKNRYFFLMRVWACRIMRARARHACDTFASPVQMPHPVPDVCAVLMLGAEEL
jgi:hypothetical protein